MFGEMVVVKKFISWTSLTEKMWGGGGNELAGQGVLYAFQTDAYFTLTVKVSEINPIQGRNYTGTGSQAIISAEDHHSTARRPRGAWKSTISEGWGARGPCRRRPSLRASP